MTTENSAIYNSYTAHWISRVESMNNTIVLVSGGIMSVTIGAFLSSNPPPLDTSAGCMIQYAWIFLALSLASAILLKFSLVVSGAFTLKGLEGKIESKSIEQEIINSPGYIRKFSWLLGTFAVVLCLLGLLLMAIGAGSLLVVQ